MYVSTRFTVRPTFAQYTVDCAETYTYYVYPKRDGQAELITGLPTVKLALVSSESRNQIPMTKFPQTQTPLFGYRPNGLVVDLLDSKL